MAEGEGLLTFLLVIFSSSALFVCWVSFLHSFLFLFLVEVTRSPLAAEIVCCFCVFGFVCWVADWGWIRSLRKCFLYFLAAFSVTGLDS